MSSGFGGFRLASHQHDVGGDKKLARQACDPFLRRGLDGRLGEGRVLVSRDDEFVAGEFGVALPLQAEWAEIGAEMVGVGRGRLDVEPLRQLSHLGAAFAAGVFVREKREIRDGAGRVQFFRRTGVNLVVQLLAQGMV